MRPRRIILMGMFLFAGFCMLYSGERLFLWVMLLTASIFALALLNIIYTLSFITVRQSVSPAELTAGEYGTLIVNIHNRGLLPFAHIDLWYDSFETLVGGCAAGKDAGELAARGFVSGVLPGGARNIREKLFFPYRGSFTPGVIKARVYDVFGLFSVRLPVSILGDKQTVTVLPRKFSPALDSWGENPFAGGVSRGRDEEEPYSVAEIRGYRPGDPLKHVHWKLSARTGKLQVKEFDGTLSPRAAVFLDLSPHGLGGEEAAAIEDCMCRGAAALCAAALEGLTPLRLAVCAEGPLALSGIAPRDLAVFRRFLALLPFNCPFPFVEFMRMEMDSHPETGHVTVVTAKMTSRLSDYLTSLSAQGHTVSLLFVKKDFNRRPAGAGDQPAPGSEAGGEEGAGLPVGISPSVAVSIAWPEIIRPADGSPPVSREAGGADRAAGTPYGREGAARRA